MSDQTVTTVEELKKLFANKSSSSNASSFSNQGKPTGSTATTAASSQASTLTTTSSASTSNVANQSGKPLPPPATAKPPNATTTALTGTSTKHIKLQLTLPKPSLSHNTNNNNNASASSASSSSIAKQNNNQSSSSTSNNSNSSASSSSQLSSTKGKATQPHATSSTNHLSTHQASKTSVSQYIVTQDNTVKLSSFFGLNLSTVSTADIQRYYAQQHPHEKQPSQGTYALISYAIAVQSKHMLKLALETADPSNLEWMDFYQKAKFGSPPLPLAQALVLQNQKTLFTEAFILSPLRELVFKKDDDGNSALYYAIHGMLTEIQPEKKLLYKFFFSSMAALSEKVHTQNHLRIIAESFFKVMLNQELLPQNSAKNFITWTKGVVPYNELLAPILNEFLQIQQRNDTNNPIMPKAIWACKEIIQSLLSATSTDADQDPNEIIYQGLCNMLKELSASSEDTQRSAVHQILKILIDQNFESKYIFICHMLAYWIAKGEEDSTDTVLNFFGIASREQTNPDLKVSVVLAKFAFEIVPYSLNDIKKELCGLEVPTNLQEDLGGDRVTMTHLEVLDFLSKVKKQQN